MLVWQVVDRDFYSIDLHHDSIVPQIHVYVTVEKQLKYMNCSCFLEFQVDNNNLGINTVCSYMSAIFTLISFCSCVWSLFSRTMNLSSELQS